MLIHAPYPSITPPHMPTNASLWLDASRGVELDMREPVSVSRWSDIRGNGVAFTQSTKNRQPQLTSLDNGSAISFNGSSTFLQSNTSLFSGNFHSVFFVLVPGTLPGNLLDTSTNTRYVFFINASRNLGANKIVTSSTDKLSANTGTVGVPVLASLLFDNTSLGMSFGGVLSGHTVEAGAVSSGSVASIGSRFSFDSGFFQGHIQELIIYNRTLTVNERHRVERILKKKWRL